MSIPPVGVRFTAQGVPQVQTAFRTVQSQSLATGAAINRTFVDGAGRVTSFGRQSVQAFSAAGFAANQFTTTGQVGFKSLASSVAGFASFFGTGGLIASGVITTGLILTDFWNRNKRAAEEAKKALGDLTSEAVDRRRKDDPTEVPLLKIAEKRRELEANQREMSAAVERRNRIIAAAQVPGAGPTSQALIDRNTAGVDAEINKLRAARAKLLDDELEGLRQLNDAQTKKRETDNKEIQQLSDAIGERKANNAQIERANVLINQSRFVIEATKNTSAEDTATMARRAEALKTLTTLTDAFKKAQDAVTEAERKRRQALADQVTQLSTLSAANKLTGQQLFDLNFLYAKLNAELLQGNVSLERRVELEQQLATIRKAGLQAPDLAVTGTRESNPLLPGERALPGRNGSAIQLPTPVIKPAPRGAAATNNAFTTTENAFADAFSSALSSGMAAGVTQFLVSGSIEGMWNNVGGAIVAGMSAINPWLGIAGGILQGLVGSLFDGRDRRPSGVLPIDIQRVVNDPNARRPVMRQQPPLAGATLLSVDSPQGRRVLATSTGAGARRGIR